MKVVAGTNLEQARSHNRRVVIEAVRTEGPITRSAIARRTALTTQTVSNIVEELEHDHILVAGAARKALRGLPVVPYSINPGGAFSIGFEVTRFAASGVLTDLAGTVRARTTHPLGRADPAEAMAAMGVMAADLLGRAPIDRARLFGAGLALPGRYSAEGTMSLSPLALPGWAGFPIASELGRSLGLAAFVENDATAAAVCERLYGAARGLDSFVYVFFGGGVGTGLLVDGHRYRGSRGNAGEIGHIVMVPDGLACSCGKRGCLDRYLSLESVFTALGIAYPNTLAEDEIDRLVAEAGPALDDWLAQAVDPLRRLIDFFERAFDPQTIVLGGPMPPRLIGRLMEAVRPLPDPVDPEAARSRPRVIAATVAADATVRGAAALPIFAETNPQFDVLQKRLAR